jgi:hypothetical protein
MQQRRHSPLYSPLGCGAALILVIGLAAILYFRGGKPFSPGPLAEAAPRQESLNGFNNHAEFEADCGQCHAPWQGITAERCESCHTTIAEERSTGAGLHGRLHDTARCENCHTEHEGRDADISLLALANFEHDRLTDFSLVKHEENFDETAIECVDCHLEDQFSSTLVDCIDCHTTGQPNFTPDHAALFGQDCFACHDGRDTLVNTFDHNDFFNLDGAHTVVDCADCHTQQVIAGTPTECAGCHEEPAVHMGLFGTDCIRCHTTAAWTPAQLTRHTFPLDHGDEGQIPCLTCHTETYADYTCYNCHEHERDETAEIHLDEGITEFEDCVACHPTGLEEEAERDD